MAGRHHYVARFHLRGFLDPLSESSAEPWLWTGDVAMGTVRRRSPRNLGWERGLYDLPGALTDRQATLERHLAENVEGPAAFALRTLSALPQGSRGPIPSQLFHYLAWAASRTPAMRSLFQRWINEGRDTTSPVVEAAPKWLTEADEVSRSHQMEHPLHGLRKDVHPDEVDDLRAKGWRFIVGTDDFAELLHVQARYFYERFFPRLNWIILDAPAREYFIIGDRPVVWGFAGVLDVPPAALRSAECQLIAPLTRSVAVIAYNPAGDTPREMRVDDVNRVVARASQDWIAGPTEETVAWALSCLDTA